MMCIHTKPYFYDIATWSKEPTEVLVLPLEREKMAL